MLEHLKQNSFKVLSYVYMENIRQLRITKTKSVLIRLTDSDLKELKRRAAELGLTVTSYITFKTIRQ
jgi:predicted DNA binding CopG/RHH family protein